MIRSGKFADETREAGPIECWFLHGAVGSHTDWRETGRLLAADKISSRAVDLWRFLDCCPMPMPEFGRVLNAEAAGDISRPAGRALGGYSMGGRLALHALVETPHPWAAAILISAHPGLEDAAEREARRGSDAVWAAKAFSGDYSAFLREWDAQPVLAGAPPRDPRTAAALALRRREIARSFVDWSLGVQRPLWDRLHEISIPVLWIVGGEDRKFLQLAERAVSLLPDAKLAVAPSTGHRVAAESPGWFADQVARFLKS